MSKIAELKSKAEALILENKIDEATVLVNQAKALKSLEDIQDTPVKAAPVRLPFGDAPDEPAPDKTPNASVKTWYVKKYGELPAANQQVADELYGNFMDVSYRKNADFRRFLRTGYGDPALSKVVLLSPEQIVNAVAAGFSVAELKATQVESADTLGGYIVPEDFRGSIIQRLPGMTIMRGLATVLTTSSDRLVLPKATGGDDRYIGAVRVTWVDESPTAGTAATNATFGQISIPVHTQMAETAVSRPMLEDPAIPIDTHLAELFANASAINEDQQFLTGDGMGKPQGILKNSTTGGPWDADISTSSSASAFTGPGVVATPYKLAAQYRANGVWVMNKTSVGVVRGLKDLQDRFLWSDNIQNLASGQPQQLAGYRVVESEAMGSAGTNYYPGIFGDMKGYTIVDRIGMSVERYLDSQTARANQAIFIMRRRLGGQVTEGWRLAVYKTT